MLDAYPDWQIPAKVRTVIPTADRQKATVKVRVAFDQLDPRILPDMGVKVTFLRRGGEPSPPTAARGCWSRGRPWREGGSPAVFVYHDGRVERRAVRLGPGARQRARGDRGPVRWRAGGDDGASEELRDGQRGTQLETRKETSWSESMAWVTAGA